MMGTASNKGTYTENNLLMSKTIDVDSNKRKGYPSKVFKTPIEVTIPKNPQEYIPAKKINFGFYN